MFSTDKVLASRTSTQDIFHVFRIDSCVDHCFALCSLFGEKNKQPGYQAFLLILISSTNLAEVKRYL